MVWDSALAGAVLESIVPYDRKESALRLFHENIDMVNIYSFILLSGITQSSIMMFSNLG